MKQKLKCLSEKSANDLYNDIDVNVERYKGGNFDDLSKEYGWSVELQVNANLDALKDLDPSSGKDSEVKNSLLVWRALNELTPGLACENRIWTRMTHLEGLDYSRQRWINVTSDETVIKSVRDHLFADTRTKWRDDNAISRLWWSAYIASLVSPIDQKTVLDLILSKADIRSNFIERSQISSRPKLAAGIIRAMMNDSWITDKENNYRVFMKQINKYGGGILFEALNEIDVDAFISQCTAVAKSGVAEIV
jgi:hypothetical protein